MTATSHFRPRWILLALIILGVPYTGAIAADSSPLMNYLQNPNPQQWPQQCAKIKENLSEFPLAFLTFTPLPKLPTNIDPVWKLNWHGLIVPVPAIQYTHLGFMNDRSPIMLILATANHHHIFLSFDSEGSEYIPSIRSIWGKHADTLHVTAYGYTVTPKSLTCAGENVKQQKRVALGLGFKIIAKHFNVAPTVHRIQGTRYGILEYGHALKGMDTYWYSLQKHRDRGYYEINYEFPEDRPSLAHVALLLAKPGAATYTSPPNWFLELQAWLDKPTQTHWCSLLSVLKRAHFNPKSLEQLAKNHPACQSPQQ